MDLPFGELESLLRIRKNFSDNRSLGLPGLSPSPPLSSYPRQLIYDDTESEEWYLGGNFSSIEEVESLMQQPSMDVVSTTQVVSDIGRYGSPVFAALKSVVPRLIADEKTLPTSRLLASNDQVFRSPLHRQILFSVANNFAGLGTFPIGDIMHILQRETAEKLYQMIRSAPGSAARAIIQNIFKAAIEAGDAMIVDLLIRENPIDAQINEQFLVTGGFRYTPIECATALRHEHVVRILVHHGADVNKTDPNEKHLPWDHLYGALDHAVCRVDNEGVYLDIHPQLCLMLLEAGGDLSYDPMLFLLREGQGELVERIMSQNSHKEATDWGNMDTLWHVIYYLDDQRAMRIVAMMLKLGIDLNEKLRCARETIIDVAAQRGSLSLVYFILDSGARLTDDTLPAAVTSGNQDLVEFLISRGAEVNSLGKLGVTPLAAAIRIQRPEIVNILETHGASPLKHFATVFRAASDVGDLQLIERLMELKGIVSPYDLGHALTVALKDGRDDSAQILISAGADVNVPYSDKCGTAGGALFYALKRRNEGLIYSLLDADANVNYYCDAYPQNGRNGDLLPLQLAIMWGNRSIIEALIFAGADLNKTIHAHTGTPLTIAVKQRSSELVQFLLASGADVNNNGNRTHGSSALEAAAESSDIEMARYLLDQGADPNDPYALREAAYRDESLFKLILERHCARYPISKGKLGTTLLVQFIEEGDEASVRQILSTGVDAEANITNGGIDERRTGFGFAIFRQQDNKDNFLEMFLEKGCNPNGVVDQSGPGRNIITAFLAAIDTQSPSIVELFIKYEADVNFPARLGVKRTPLQRAAELGSLEIVDILVNRGADVNAPAAARGGGTALQLAAKGCYIPAVCRLLSLGANVNAPGSIVNGRTALEAAAEHGRLDMVQILFNAGAASRLSDRGQITNAMTLAKDNGHFGVCDLLEQHLHPETEGNGLETLGDGMVEDITGSTLDDDPLSL